tara:strand:+ start:493 stop:882 length:390 start_codon:yes stop_codon:yes gene_type:complete
MFPIVSGVAMGQGAAAFAIAVTDNSPASQIVLPQQGLPSNPGEINFVVAASGGSGSYTYTWLLILTDSGGGMLSIAGQGTTNGTTYSDAQVVGGTNAGQPGILTIRCTVSDGVATDIVSDTNMTSIALY